MLFQVDKAVEKRSHDVIVHNHCMSYLYMLGTKFASMLCIVDFFLPLLQRAVFEYINPVPHRSTSICTLHQSDLDETAKKKNTKEPIHVQ